MYQYLRYLSVVLISMALGLGAAPLYAQNPGKPFKSPLKNFAIMIPEFPFGTTVQKQNSKEGGTVSFLGVTGAVRRIDYTRLPTDIALPTDSTELQALYHMALDDLLRANPSSLLTERPYTLDNAVMLLAPVSFPAGSHLQDAASGKRMDSIRGVLIFARGGFMYLLHTELSANVFNRPEELPFPLEELNRRVEIFIPELYRSITFL